MKKMIVVFVGCMMLCVGITGCTSASMNYQRATARTSGDLSITVVLENASTKVSRDQVIKICTDIKTYLAGVDLANIDRAKLQADIESRIPIAQLKPIAAMLVSKIPTDVSKLENGKVLVNECLDGVILGATKFDISQVTISK